MWGGLLEKGKALADQAKAAAEALENRLDESVGVETTEASSKIPSNDNAWGDDDDGAFDDDDDIIFNDDEVDPPTASASSASSGELNDTKASHHLFADDDEEDTKPPPPEPPAQQNPAFLPVTEDVGSVEDNEDVNGGWDNEEDLDLDDDREEEEDMDEPTEFTTTNKLIDQEQEIQQDSPPKMEDIEEPLVVEDETCIESPMVTTIQEEVKVSKSEETSEEDDLVVEEGWTQDDEVDEVDLLEPEEEESLNTTVSSTAIQAILSEPVSDGNKPLQEVNHVTVTTELVVEPPASESQSPLLSEVVSDQNELPQDEDIDMSAASTEELREPQSPESKDPTSVNTTVAVLEHDKVKEEKVSSFTIPIETIPSVSSITQEDGHKTLPFTIPIEAAPSVASLTQEEGNETPDKNMRTESFFTPMTSAAPNRQRNPLVNEEENCFNNQATGLNDDDDNNDDANNDDAEPMTTPLTESPHFQTTELFTEEESSNEQEEEGKPEDQEDSNDNCVSSPLRSNGSQDDAMDLIQNNNETSKNAISVQSSAELHVVQQSLEKLKAQQDIELKERIAQVKEEHRISIDNRISQLNEEHQLALVLVQSQVEDVTMILKGREDQLESKVEQIILIQEQNELEKEELRSKIKETKEEAKRRLLKAKERMEEIQKQLMEANRRAESVGAETGSKEEIISALRAEGEKLAMKQSHMEKSVRTAKSEARELIQSLDAETDAKILAEEKVADLEMSLKEAKDELSSARKGETRSVKLETDLVNAREECEKIKGLNLSLEQQIKELKSSNKELKKGIDETKKVGLQESERESKQMKKEHSDVLSDLEMKLRTVEREANLREDSLRHEVGELRKRWQDAMRRADALSMDVQESTKPLMRQLESTERQNRVRAAAWGELETRLRSDLEEQVIQNENILKERSELTTNHARLERLANDRLQELNVAKDTIEELNETIDNLEVKLEETDLDRKKFKQEWERLDRSSNEGASKVRNEMMQTIMESEERYRGDIYSLENQLKEEKERRTGLEAQLNELPEHTESFDLVGSSISKPAKEKKLCSSEDQTDILKSTLLGLGSEDEEDDVFIATEGENTGDDTNGSAPSLNSFAAMEQLSQGLKAAKLELASLRKQLTESEEVRQNLVADLTETSQAREKLSLFEIKVKELTQEVQEKTIEIQCLNEDIQEVRVMYRSQLDGLLEEKAAMIGPPTTQFNEGKQPSRESEAVTSSNGYGPSHGIEELSY